MSEGITLALGNDGTFHKVDEDLCVQIYCETEEDVNKLVGNIRNYPNILKENINLRFDLNRALEIIEDLNNSILNGEGRIADRETLEKLRKNL